MAKSRLVVKHRDLNDREIRAQVRSQWLLSTFGMRFCLFYISVWHYGYCMSSLRNNGYNLLRLLLPISVRVRQKLILQLSLKILCVQFALLLLCIFKNQFEQRLQVDALFRWQEVRMMMLEPPQDEEEEEEEEEEFIQSTNNGRGKLSLFGWTWIVLTIELHFYFLFFPMKLMENHSLLKKFVVTDILMFKVNNQHNRKITSNFQDSGSLFRT